MPWRTLHEYLERDGFWWSVGPSLFSLLHIQQHVGTIIKPALDILLLLVRQVFEIFASGGSLLGNYNHVLALLDAFPDGEVEPDQVRMCLP